MVVEKGSWNSESLESTIRKNIHEGAQLFLDYDGTLVPIILNPEESLPPESVKKLLSRIALKYDLYVVSGRSVEDLEKFLGPDLNFIAMHGACARIGGKVMCLKDDYMNYVHHCREIEEMHIEKSFEGLRVYPKGGGILFHLGLVSKDRRERVVSIVSGLAKQYGMELYIGKDIAEIKIPGSNKGDAIKMFRNNKPCLVAGDEMTDEYAFSACPECISIHVGNSKTAAKYSVPDVESFLSVLDILA
ncbi:MAG: trehalose-phosphatase [Candidatus Thermoplasmatota archaeon]|nr:trehalose-phosphatase [Candidatus Thermoplasmatota archaeon]